jgi:hypothetical protein
MGEAARITRVRRKTHDLHVCKETVTTAEVLRRTGELYATEEQICRKLPDCRRGI